MFLLKLFLFFFSFFCLYCDTPDFDNLKSSKNSIIFLSTPRSGTNLISASLQTIIKKPIASLEWEKNFYKFKTHPMYNRLKIPLISEEPFIFRTHGEYKKLTQIPSEFNKLIFVTRNPKELLFRKISNQNIKSSQFWVEAEKVLNYQMELFNTYESWNEENRMLIFYEDFINQSVELIPKILSFIGENDICYQDYVENKDRYQSMILKSYSK